MLIGFAILGSLAAWRAGGISRGTMILWTIGAGLALAALIPGLGRLAYLAVYLPTSIIGYIVSHVVLTLMFFLIITPLGLVLKLMGKDLLQKRRQPQWRPVRGVKSEDSYYRQF